jgi:gluconolactonase
VFARLPASARESTKTSEFADTVGRLMGKRCDSFLEGPSFDRSGSLYYVDVAYGRIFRIAPGQQLELFVEYDGEPNGLKIHRDGRLFVADRHHGLIVIDPADRLVHHLLTRAHMEPFRGPNDLVFAANGDLYFTDQGMSDALNPTGRVFRRRADGRLELLLDHLPSPNGIALDASERTLYVAMTRTNLILRASLLPDGRATRIQHFIQLSGGGGPDGLAADEEGGLAVAHPQMGAVWLFDWKGQPRLRVNLCEGILGTNLAYGGPDGRHLYITEAQTGTIQMAEMPVRGATMFSHRSELEKSG